MVITLLYLTDLHSTPAKFAEFFNAVSSASIIESICIIRGFNIYYKLYVKCSKRSWDYCIFTCFGNIKICLKINNNEYIIIINEDLVNSVPWENMQYIVEGFHAEFLWGCFCWERSNLPLPAQWPGCPCSQEVPVVGLSQRFKTGRFWRWQENGKWT